MHYYNVQWIYCNTQHLSIPRAKDGGGGGSEGYRGGGGGGLEGYKCWANNDPSVSWQIAPSCKMAAAGGGVKSWDLWKTSRILWTWSKSGILINRVSEIQTYRNSKIQKVFQSSHSNVGCDKYPPVGRWWGMPRNPRETMGERSDTRYCPPSWADERNKTSPPPPTHRVHLHLDT